MQQSVDGKHRWHFTHHTTDAWDAVLKAVEGAERSVDFEQFILMPSSISGALFAALIKAVRRGVRVRVIVDLEGSRGLRDSDEPERLREAGGALVFYRPQRSPIIRIPDFLPHFLPRDHRKLVIVDGRAGFVGGICFDDAMRTWRDTLLRIEGPVVEQICEGFEQSWQAAQYQSVPTPVVVEHLRHGFSYATNTADRAALTHSVLNRLRDAQSEIRIMTPYFVPDRPLERRLRDAAARGVRLEILVPSRSDHRLVDAVSRRILARLLPYGAQIWMHQKRLLHAKMIVVDDWAMVGSLNLDQLSLHTNLENALLADDPIFVAEVKRRFEEDRKDCLPLTPEVWRTRSWTERILGLIALPLRPAM